MNSAESTKNAGGLMTHRKSEAPDIFENLTELHEILWVGREVVEFFVSRFREELTHDDSEQTRKRILSAKEALVDNINEMITVLYAIDPDLVLEWHICNCDDEDDDEE
jgi:hypothetical protein